MSASQSQSYKDARARIFHTNVAKHVTGKREQRVAVHHTAPNVAALARKQSLTPAARAETTASWVGTMAMLEVHNGEGWRQAERSRFPSTVVTDCDIDDECSTVSSILTVETTQQPHNCTRPPRTQISAVLAQRDWMAYTTPTQDAWEQSITSEVEADLTAAATLLCRSVNPSSRPDLENTAAPLPSTLQRDIRVSSTESSANLDAFAQEREPKSNRVKGGAPWVNRRPCNGTIEEKVC